jgi:hypothetical protein
MDQFFRVQKIEKRFQRKAQHDYDHLNLNPEITFAMSSEVYTLQDKEKMVRTHSPIKGSFEPSFTTFDRNFDLIIKITKSILLS